MPQAKKSQSNQNQKESGSEYSRLYRSETDKVIAGVAGGLGEYFSIDSTIIRVLFVLLAVFGGSGVIVYIILWLIIPTKSSGSGLTSETIKSNIEDIKSTTQTIAHNIRPPKKRENSKFLWALMIIALGFLFLLNNYGILNSLELDRLWPLILIFLGLTIILRQ